MDAFPTQLWARELIVIRAQSHSLASLLSTSLPGCSAAGWALASPLAIYLGAPATIDGLESSHHQRFGLHGPPVIRTPLVGDPWLVSITV